MQENELDVMQRIASHSVKMSKGQKRIASFILNHYDRASFMTAANLGLCADVSESTVVRFAMALGYEGFPEMQAALQELVRNKLTNQQRIELVDSGDEKSTIIETLKADMNNLRSTIDEVDPAEFSRMLDCLVESREVYICGHRSSSVLAQFLEYYLSYIFPHIHLLTTGVQDYYDRLTRINEKDILIAISYPRYSNRTVEVARIAKQKGTPVCAITDSRVAPIAKLSDFCLMAKSSMATFVDSMVAPMSIINAIIVACGQRRKSDLQAYFTELEHIWKSYHVYSEPDGRS